jgi:hypothetical protein
VGAVEQCAAAFTLEGFGFDPVQAHFQSVGKSPMEERFIETLVRVLVPSVLADDVNGQLVGRVLDAIDQLFPGVGARPRQRQPELLQDDLIEPLGLQHERHFVNRVDVFRRDDRFFRDVAEQRDLPLDVRVEEPVRAAEEYVWLNTD